jgi:histone-lysine N-methyltransferase SETD1
MWRAPTAASLVTNSSIPLLPLDTHEAAEQAARRAGSHRADSSVNSPRRASAFTATAARASPLVEDKKNTSHSPIDHEHRRGDFLNGIGSDSSLSSNHSSIFSLPNTKMSYPGRAASLHALTPLTSSDSSPPGKLASPRSAKFSHELPHATAAPPHSAPPGPSHTLTENTCTAYGRAYGHARYIRPSSRSQGTGQEGKAGQSGVQGHS